MFWPFISSTKLEKILKGCLDSIPSPLPSVKIQIQIIGGKVKNKKFVDTTQQCFGSLPQVNFPVNNLNFQ